MLGRAVLLIALLGPFAVAAQTEVDLELVLLADSSGSITDDEIRFQRQGYATALTDPAVLSAVGNTSTGSIAITYVEWGQFDSMDIVAPWTVIASSNDATLFAGAMLAAPRKARGRNAIGQALLFGRDLIELNDIGAWRRIIDISADSTGNFNGPSIAEGRAAALAAGITINGLAVLCRDCSAGTGSGRDLEGEFVDKIIGGPGSFVITADNPAAFAEAVKRKLILEISGDHGGPAFAAAP
jgi:Protein of unknown function (DUF1194)